MTLNVRDLRKMLEHLPESAKLKIQWDGGERMLEPSDFGLTRGHEYFVVDAGDVQDDPWALFKMEVINGPKALEVLAIAKSEEDAKRHVGGKFTGWEIANCVEILLARTKHFVLAELEE